MQQCGVIANSDVLAAEVFQLFRIKPRRAFADAVEVEPFPRLIVREELIIAVAPAQTGQIVAHTSGRVAHLLVFFCAKRAVAFRKLLAVGAVNQGDVGVNWQGPAHGVIDHHLTRGIIQVVIPADHMGYAHVMIINNNSQHVNRGAIRA